MFIHHVRFLASSAPPPWLLCAELLILSNNSYAVKLLCLISDYIIIKMSFSLNCILGWLFAEGQLQIYPNMNQALFSILIIHYPHYLMDHFFIHFGVQIWAL